MDRSVALRAALLQAGLLALLAIALGVALPRSFFVDWGWAAGPGVWALCAAVTALVLRLPIVAVLAGAAVAGLPSLVGVLAGVHWIGAPLGVALLALWCGRLAAHEPRRRGHAAPRASRLDSASVGPLAQLAEQGTSTHKER